MFDQSAAPLPQTHIEDTPVTDRIETDICIIGAGAGGLSVAAGAAQMGARVVLLEGHKMGGDCLNYGCVPSKALIAAGKQAHAMGAGQGLGVAPVMAQVDYGAAKDHVAQAIATIAPHDSQERFEGFGIKVIREYGRFISKTEVQAGDTVITARRFVIATGSGPFVPPIPGLDTVPHYTNETIFDLRTQPTHLIIIGGGVIGMEMAQAHIRLGCRVTVLEGELALGREDPEMAGLVLDTLRAEGVEIVEGAQVAAVSGSEGDIRISTEDGRSFEGSHLLVAVGRKVHIDKLDLDKAGIAHDRAVKVDDRLRSVTNKRVFAIGDAAGGPQFTHVAGYHAGVVVRSAVLGMGWAKASTDHLPYATFTDPEMAQVGLTEAQARKKYGKRLDVVRARFDDLDRAVTDGKTRGLVKVMVVKGRPVGASIVGPQAGELIAMWSMAIANKMKMSAISATVLPYPTLMDVNKRAASAYFSPKLFENPTVKRVVGLVQRWLP
ncbi:MAG: FAD-dependent oxidoreductase [Oceanicola sp.]|nr:FAD-dependent oxidoreductase [Oceanicola sp.]